MYQLSAKLPLEDHLLLLFDKKSFYIRINEQFQCFISESPDRLTKLILGPPERSIPPTISNRARPQPTQSSSLQATESRRNLKVHKKIGRNVRDMALIPRVLDERTIAQAHA